MQQLVLASDWYQMNVFKLLQHSKHWQNQSLKQTQSNKTSLYISSPKLHHFCGTYSPGFSLLEEKALVFQADTLNFTRQHFIAQIHPTCVPVETVIETVQYYPHEGGEAK